MKKLTLTDESKKLLADHPEFTKKWIEGLRSRKYIQCRARLCNPEIPNSACCLHVMQMECCGTKWEDGSSLQWPYEGTLPVDQVPNLFRFCDGTLPQHLDALYLFDEDSEEDIYGPSSWNDELNLSFLQIADLLENGIVEWDDE